MQPDDIVTYWSYGWYADNDGNPCYGYYCTHSAVVESIENNIIVCISKWGQYGLYRHDIDKVPDEYKYNGEIDTKYYRYTQDEHSLSIDEDNGESGHTFVCTAEKTVNGVHKTCSYTTECDGEFTVTSVNSSYHRIYCSNCYYSEYVDHDLYIYSAAYEDYVVKCHDCSYTIECTEEPEYIDGDETGHWVDCTCGCYSFYEEHDYNYMPLLSNDSNRLYYHIATCRVCTGTHYLAHNWVNDVGGDYMCTLCGVSEDSVPGIMSLPDPELEAYLASLSGEELEEFIASLPEDQVARVTALLPSDDENLTE